MLAGVLLLQLQFFPRTFPIIRIIERATPQISPGPGVHYLCILEFERKSGGNLPPLQGGRGAARAGWQARPCRRANFLARPAAARGARPHPAPEPGLSLRVDAAVRDVTGGFIFHSLSSRKESEASGAQAEDS